MKYIVEYILNTDHEWAVWFKYGRGTVTSPMDTKSFLAMDEKRKLGEYIFLTVEVRP